MAKLLNQGTTDECFACEGPECRFTFSTRLTKVMGHECGNFKGKYPQGRKKMLYLCPICGKLVKTGGPTAGGHYTPAIMGESKATCVTLRAVNNPQGKDLPFIANLPTRVEEDWVYKAIQDLSGTRSVVLGAAAYGVDGVNGWGTFILHERHFHDEGYVKKALKLAMHNTVAAEMCAGAPVFEPMPVNVMKDFDYEFERATGGKFQRVLFASSGSDSLSLICGSLGHQNYAHKSLNNLLGKRNQSGIPLKGLVKGGWGGGRGDMLLGECGSLDPMVCSMHPSSESMGWMHFDLPWGQNKEDEFGSNWDSRTAVQAKAVTKENIHTFLKDLDVVVVQVFDNARCGKWLLKKPLLLLLEVAIELGTPVVMDEVFTCGGRTMGGHFFAFEEYGDEVYKSVAAVTFGKATVVHGAALNKETDWGYKELLTNRAPALETLKGWKVLNFLNDNKVLATGQEAYTNMCVELDNMVRPLLKDGEGERCAFNGAVWHIPKRLFEANAGWPQGYTDPLVPPTTRICVFVDWTKSKAKLFVKRLSLYMNKEQIHKVVNPSDNAVTQWTCSISNTRIKLKPVATAENGHVIAVDEVLAKDVTIAGLRCKNLGAEVAFTTLNNNKNYIRLPKGDVIEVELKESTDNLGIFVQAAKDQMPNVRLIQDCRGQFSYCTNYVIEKGTPLRADDHQVPMSRYVKWTEEERLDGETELLTDGESCNTPCYHRCLNGLT